MIQAVRENIMTPQPTPIKWLTKEEAASILGISPRRVLEYVQEEKLESARMRNPETGQTNVRIHAGSVERMKWERENPSPQPPRTSAEIAKRAPADEAAGIKALTQLAKMVDHAAEPRMPSPSIADLWQRLYVTPHEAVQMTGIGLSVLAKRVKGERIGTRGALVYRVKELRGL